MNHTRSPRPARRGSALMMAVLAVLVLTGLGLGLAWFSSAEDRMSGTDKFQKEGFYAAEAGLRVGEQVLAGAMQDNAAVTSLLTSSSPIVNPNDSPATLDLHDGGFTAVLLKSGGTPYRDQPVSLSTGDPTEKPIYSLYVRNNSEDPSNKGDQDLDKKVNLISVGFVRAPGGMRITKILEEQVSASTTGTEGGPQKEGNSGGTGGV